MAFPVDPLTVLVEVALGADLTADPATWAWTDVTAYIYTRDSISITRGRPDQASKADSSTLQMTANNRDGRWSTRNPNGPWFGQLRKGTPVRVSAEGHVRFTGFFSELPPRWDVSGQDRHAPLTAKGLFYRLTQGASPERSPLHRTILGANATQPSAYWRLEDGPDATSSLASSVPGGSPMRVIGSPLIGTSLIAGASACVDLGGSASAGTASNPLPELRGDVTMAATGEWRFEGVLNVGTDPYQLHGFILRSQANGTTFFWYINVQPSGNAQLLVDSLTNGVWGVVEGESIPWPEVIDLFDGLDHHYAVTCQANGASADWEFFIDGVSQATGSFLTALGLATPVPPIFRVTVNETGVYQVPPTAYATFAVGHIALYDSIADPGGDRYQATVAYMGEEAHTRVLRLCEEEGIPGTSNATESLAMGLQGVKTILDLARECEATDQGYLYEGLDFGFVFQSHTERENLPAAVEVDYEEPGHIAPPLEPTDDDRDARNDVEVQREGGSSSRATEESTAVELSIPNIGRRDESLTVSLGVQDQAANLAGWRLRLGTWPGYRFPLLTSNLAAGPDLIDDFCEADLAFRMTILNPPDDIGPESPDLVVEGYTETLGPYDWLVESNCSLYGPWRVGELSDTTADQNEYVGRLAGDDAAAIRAAVDDNDVSFAFDPNRCRWTTAADDFDPDLKVRLGGELVAVSGIATTAVTYVAAGALAHADNAAVAPAIYAGAAADDWICVLARIRAASAGVLTTPDGYSRIEIVGYTSATEMQLYAKVHSGSESNPTITPSGGAAGDTVSAVTFGLRGMPITLDDLNDAVVTSYGLTNASAANIAYPGIYPIQQEGTVVLALGGKDDDWTSVAQLTGFTEAVDGSTTTGSDQGLVVDYQIQTTPAVVREGSFVVTGGASAVSNGALIAFAAGYQTLTVSARAVNGVTKSHAAGTRIEVEDAFVLAL